MPFGAASAKGGAAGSALSVLYAVVTDSVAAAMTILNAWLTES